ncbi:MAG: ABC transporter permease, partial [Bacteroidota bacterium]
MQRLGYIIQKEFIQIFRNKAMLPLMTIAPIVQMIVLSFAASSEVKNVRLAIVDQDKSAYSRLLIRKIQVADRFIITDFPAAVSNADDLMQKGEVDIVLTVPPNFERQTLKEKGSTLQLLVNAINGQQATVGAGYLTSIIQSLNQEIRLELMPAARPVSTSSTPSLQTESSNWYNPQLNFKYFMVPGIMGELATLLVLLLTA